MVEAIVLGRVGVDLTPSGARTSLAAAASFVRGVGGYGGNVSVGLSRQGVSTRLVSAVGDDGHGEHVRSYLPAVGVDVGGVVVRPGRRTQVAFFEAWPPETFPVTFHRDTTAPETTLSASELAAAIPESTPLVLVSGALLAEEPARTSVLQFLEERAGRRPRTSRITVLDLDWRPSLWPDPREAPAVIARAVGLADVVIGSDDEFEASGLRPADVLGLGPHLVALKHGSAGSTAITRDETVNIDAIRVEVVCALGAGDAFAAVLASGLLRGVPIAMNLARANAAGAIVASRLLCSNAMPTGAEIDALLAGRSVVSGRFA